MIKNYKVRLHVLTPIHIGMGDCYDPTQFVFDKDGHMWVFDTNDFLKSLSPEKSEEFCKLAASSNNPIPVFRFFRDNFNKDKIKCRQIKAHSDLCQRYNEICESSSWGKEVINRFELKRTIANPIKGVPYIPGSSLKGCLKTIWMSEINRRSPSGVSNERDIMTLEKTILRGTFDKDPFRFIKISDLYPIKQDDVFLSRIMHAVMFSKSQNQGKKQRSDLTVALEVIPVGNIFEGVITIDDEGYLPEESKTARGKYLTMECIMDFARGYYIKDRKTKDANGVETQKSSKAKAEINLLAKMDATGFNCSEDYLARIGKDCFPVRIGHHSSAEFITIDNNRSIKITPPGVRPPKFADSATTVWLASSRRKPESPKGLIAFGWAMLEFEEMK